MPRQLAFAACSAFIVWLLYRDVKANPTVTRAVWIPWVWMTIAGSKSLTQWIYGFGSGAPGSAQVVSIDRNLIIVLIILGILILTKRSISWSSYASKNLALSCFLIYTFASIAWSDVPVTAFTQWHHMLLQFLMILVICTEPDPGKAFYALFRRSAYVLIPLSVVYIKYYPELGRRFSFWNGAAENVGVTDGKNQLGQLSWVMALFFLSAVLTGPKGKRLVSGTNRYIDYLFLAMCIWLLSICETSTALVAFIISAGVVLSIQSKAIRRNFTVILIVGAVFAGTLQVLTNIKDTIILALGEDVTLTGRTELWADLAKISINPLLGTGFESFWSGDRLAFFWGKYWWHPNQAHNGYYEMYLNLGIIGMFVLLAMLLACYSKARGQMLASGPDGERTCTEEDGLSQFKLAFVLAFILTNWTDASFKGGAYLFLIFIAVSLENVPPVPKRAGRRVANAMRTPRVLQESS